MLSSIEHDMTDISSPYEEFVKTGKLYAGTIIYKDNTSPKNKRFLWLDPGSLELRWINHTTKSNSKYNRISLSRIHGLSKIQDDQTYGFQLDTHNHNIKFWAKCEEDRDIWAKTINDILKESKAVTLDEKHFFPNDENSSKNEKIRKSNTQLLESEAEDMLSNLTHVLGIYSYENILENIKDRLNEDNSTIASLQKQITENNLTPESSSLLKQVTVLQEKISNLEEKKIKYDSQMYKIQSLENISQIQKNQIIENTQILDELIQDKDQAIVDGKEYKEELDFLTLRNYQVEKLIEMLDESEKSKDHAELLKGILGQVRFDKEYEERIILVSPNFDKLVFGRPNNFTAVREVLYFSEVLNLSIPTKPDIFLHVTMQVHCINSRFGISVPQDKAKILGEISDLYNKYQNSCSESQENLLALRLKENCSILDKQLRFVEKFIKLYKSAVIKSIFEVENSMSSIQSMYLGEIAILEDVTNRLIPSLVSNECDCYLNKDRKELINKISLINRSIANCNRETELLLDEIRRIKR